MICEDDVSVIVHTMSCLGLQEAYAWAAINSILTC